MPGVDDVEVQAEQVDVAAVRRASRSCRKPAGIWSSNSVK